MEVLPQHIRVDIDGVCFYSDFDSGNLMRVERVTAYEVSSSQYNLWVAPDAYGRGFNAYRVWFNFAVKGLRKGSIVKFSIVNLGNMRHLYGNFYRPVFKVLPNAPDWTRLTSECTFVCTGPNMHCLTWFHEVQHLDSTICFAFTLPYSYEQALQTVEAWEDAVDSSITYFYRELLTYSVDRRRVDLITVTARENIKTEREQNVSGLFPLQVMRCYRYCLLRGKKPIVFLTARVHPGETPGSYMLDGFVKTVLANDRRGELLRKNFVFKIIPMLNPDGVARGHYRVDQFGLNLNRCYLTPSPFDQPSIYAVRNYLEYLHFVERSVHSYLDFHAHASKRNCFVFGNCFTDFDKQVETRLLTLLFSINSAYFDYADCDFSEKSMRSKDPKDINSKEGSGRVAIYRATGLTLCYTVECFYHSSKIPTQHVVKRPEGGISEIYAQGPPYYGRPIFEDVGHGIAVSLLDFIQANTQSKVLSSEYRSIEGLRDKIKSELTAKSRPGIRRILRLATDKPPVNVRRIIHHNGPLMSQRPFAKLSVVSPSLTNPSTKISRRLLRKEEPKRCKSIGSKKL